MPLYKRNSVKLTAENICIALREATAEQSEGIKYSLNLSGFKYRGTGFNFCGDNIQCLNKYLLDAGEDTDLHGRYWNGSINNSNDWYDLNNWWTDLTFLNNADGLPSSTDRVFALGNCTLYVNLDNPKWIKPNFIDANNISADIDVCLYSTGNINLTGTISGVINTSGVNFYSETNYGQYWYGSMNDSSDWYDLNNWWTDSTLSMKANHLPEADSLVYACGSQVLCINLDDNRWVQPALIFAQDISVNPNVCIYTLNLEPYNSFVVGSVSLSGVPL
jgi:hypothetical protein